MTTIIFTLVIIGVIVFVLDWVIESVWLNREPSIIAGIAVGMEVSAIVVVLFL